MLLKHSRANLLPMLDVLCVGHASYDITMAATHHPQADEKMLANAMQLAGGGPAANAAVCIARLGGKAAFCGYLGHDLFGETHLKELKREGVDTSLVVRGDYPTPVSQILAKPDGSRSVINFKVDTPTLTANAIATPKPAKIIMFDGHEPSLSQHLCQWAKRHGMITVLDAGSLHQGTRALTKTIDYLIASEKFSSQLTEADDSRIALQRLRKHTACAVITMGNKGLSWSRKNEYGGMHAFEVDAIDSTGAGDAFHAAFAYGMSQHMAWDALLRYASAAGALACTKLGARTSLPDAGQVEALLKQA